MPEIARVWAVDLGEGSSLEELQGELSLERDRLRFTSSGTESDGGLDISLRDVVKARRLRGSPVLLVVHQRQGMLVRTAFYFVQPPSLTAFREGQADRATLATLRNPRRKARRQNVGYLGVMNRTKKAQVAEWERAVRAAKGAARSN